jgi:hypothetical protein
MTKYAVKEKVDPREVNKMGTAAYVLDPREELVSTVLSTFVQKSYYESENEIVNRIKKAAANCSAEFVAKTAIYTRAEVNMRTSSHLLAGELAPRISGREWGARFYENIILRPDDMSEILGYYLQFMAKGKGKKIPNAIKKGFKARLERLDAYLIDKYKMPSRSISMIDLVNLFHPKPNQKNEEAFARLLKGEALDDLYSTKILEKEKSKAGKTATTTAEKAEVKAEAIRDTLDTNLEDMPIMNLLRNLKSILENTPDRVPLACEILTNPEKVKRSRLLPFRFVSAYTEVAKLDGSGIASKVQFETGSHSGVPKVLEALEKAINISCENIVKLVGNTAILIDHSGSMRGDRDRGGSGTISAFSSVTSAVIANLFGCMLMQTQDNVFMGLFGDRLIRVNDIDRSKGILKNNEETHALGSNCGGNTEHGIFEFFNDVVKNKIKVDNVVIFSDMVIGDGGNSSWYGHGSVGEYNTGSRTFDRIFRDFKKVNPQAKVMSVDIHQTSGTTVFNKNLGVTQVSGWSERIFDTLATMSRGYKDLIDEIEKIKL